MQFHYVVSSVLRRLDRFLWGKVTANDRHDRDHRGFLNLNAAPAGLEADDQFVPGATRQ